jgi:hypothetical protein
VFARSTIFRAREELGWKPVEGTQELLDKAIRIYGRSG